MALLTDLYGEDDPNATKPQQSPTSIVKQGLQPNQPTPSVTPSSQSVFDPNASTPSTVSPVATLPANPDPLAFSGTPLNSGTPQVGPFGLPPGAGGPQGGAGPTSTPPKDVIIGAAGQPTQWNPTLSNDPAIKEQVRLMNINGIDPTTGQSTARQQSILNKGYTTYNNTDTNDSYIVTPDGKHVDPRTLTDAQLAALPDSARGAIAQNPDDRTAYQAPQAAADVAPSTNPNLPALIDQLRKSTPASGADPLTTGGNLGVAQANALKGLAATGGGLTGGAATATQSATQAPAFSALGAATPSTTPTTPQNALTNQTLSVGALNDPFQIAKQQFDAFQSSTAPEYQAELRDAMRQAAAGGALGSGQLQSRLGDVSNYRSGQLDAQKQNLLANALGIQNDNAYKNVGIAQQQQGFQNSQQQQAFNNEVQRQSLQEALTNGSFGRALQQLNAGNQGNPADIQTLLSQIFGSQASAASNAAGNLAKGQGQQAGVGNSGNQLMTLLQSIFGGG